MKQWWKETVFYQIYMPSFCDGNHDGIGDFKGMMSKLPYLKKLGVGGLWLTPFYPSPKVDNGYDISDYYGIDEDYGTMADFEAFIAKAHELGIRVISDIVINHTSDQHPWFLESKRSTDNAKRDWYVWQAPKDGHEPNNWESFFGGSAWAYDETTKMYYYHSFAKEQVDLNWANPAVGDAIFEMLDFWRKKGVDGFRLDVINNVTLDDAFLDNPFDENGEQRHLHDVNQKGIHEFMRRLKDHFDGEDPVFLVEEISSDDLDVIASYAGEGQLDTTFNFNLGSQPDFCFERFFGELSKMTARYDGDCYPTIFFGSHDMPRFPSRFGFDKRQAKTLFTLMMTYRAIPFIYFGDEIGMENYRCESRADARDIQGVLAYESALADGKSKTEAMADLVKATRDYSRNTMYWDDTAYGGFSDAAPWINYQKQSIESAGQQTEDEKSLFSYVAKLTALRGNRKTLMFGSCTVESPKDGVIICKRAYDGEKIISVMNFSDDNFEMQLEAAEMLTVSEEGGANILDGWLCVRAHDSVVAEIGM